MRHDRLVLTLLRHELRNSLRSLSRSDVAWIFLGGGSLLAYGVTDMVIGLRAAAGMIRQRQELLAIGSAAAILAAGLLIGLGIGGLAARRSLAPFLKALPLSLRERRRMAAAAALVIGAPLVLVVGAAAALACILIALPHPAIWSLTAAILFAAGFGVGLCLRLFQSSPTGIARDPTTGGGRPPLLRLGILDRSRPAWLHSWAWALPGGQVRPTGRLVGTSLAFGIAAILSVSASLTRHQATPGAVVGLIGGLAMFMLSLRFHPLGSPVLRSAPLGFTPAWLRLLRLPLQMSAAFFALSAAPAWAADPAAWAMPVSCGVWLLMLNGAYAIFATYFLTAPLIAALSFFAAIAYTSYESIEYGRTVVFAFIVLLAWLWYRARRRYYNG